MTVHFTMEEQTTISLYHPENGRMATIQAMNESLPHTEDPTVAALLRGAVAKLNLCSDKEFASCDFDDAATMFE